LQNMTVEQEKQHARLNRRYWNKLAKEYAETGRRAWNQDEPTWGIWGIKESEARILPNVKDMDVIELGCGTAYLSAWLARRGARAIGIDNSEQQLKTAKTLQEEHNLHFPLIHANAESAPLRDHGFDLVISEYGACIWCDPYKWIPEASRLLRPGGRLIFLGNATILTLCVPDEENIPASDKLIREYFGMHRFVWPDGQSVEFHLGYGDWIRLLRSSGFIVENLIELRPPEGSTTGYPFVKLDWARRWPSEEVWIAKKQ
jgi:SAM-dependent methyltransferase